MTNLHKGIAILAFIFVSISALPVHAAEPVDIGKLLTGQKVGGATITNVRILQPGESANEPSALRASGKTVSTVRVPSGPAASFSLSRKDLPTASTTASTTIRASAIVSKDDLSKYTQNVMEGEPRLRSVTYAENSVSIDYSEPAKLFAFIPIQMNAHASVDDTGTVTITYPWYHSLVKALDTKNIRTDIEAHTYLMLQHLRDTDANAHITARQQAELFDQLRVALENNESIEAGTGQ